MPQSFTDRWGSPVFGERQHAVDLLDEAVEQLVSLSGDPAAFAQEAAARVNTNSRYRVRVLAEVSRCSRDARAVS